MIGDALRISRLALVAAVDRFAIWIVLLALLALATTLSDAFLRPAYLGTSGSGAVRPRSERP